MKDGGISKTKTTLDELINTHKDDITDTDALVKNIEFYAGEVKKKQISNKK